MPDEVQSPDAPAEAPAAPEPAAAEPAAGAAGSLNTLTEAFRDPAARQALKERASTVGPPTSSDDGGSPEESAPDGASKPDEKVAPPLSRRGAAQAIADRDAEIERLASEKVAERAKAEQAQARLDALEREAEAARREVLAEIGDDKDFARLQDARLHNRSLSYEEDEQLDRMLVARGKAHVYWQLAERGHQVVLAKQLGDRAAKYGLDEQAVIGADLAAVVDHAVAATEARVRKEEAEKRADLERELKGLRPRAAASRTRAPTTGGSSAPGGARGLPDDGASPMDWFRAGIESGAHRAQPSPAPRR